MPVNQESLNGLLDAYKELLWYHLQGQFGGSILVWQEQRTRSALFLPYPLCFDLALIVQGKPQGSRPQY